ncbi:hypothetical protein NHH63_14890 [Xanthomonas campestris pv. campestris]|nr:hypothetical protein [Xanthomonas campestris]MDO0791826.1 hypothetical protein [Xanthomonas campestris pv. campestris]MDO0839047.1 hypothetical protein [Xanthomonas campestris pv. campestris]
MPVAEVDTVYGVRPEGSQSKLNTWRDGWRILTTIVKLFKAERPLLFFSIGFLFSAALSIVLAVPLLQTYLETGLVPLSNRDPVRSPDAARFPVAGVRADSGHGDPWSCRVQASGLSRRTERGSACIQTCAERT